MNDKLEEYKSNKAKSLGIKGGPPLATFHDGFDAAIALDLPVKFNRYVMSVTTGMIGNQYICKDLALQLGRGKSNVGFTVEELYQYYIDNVYIPE